MWNYPHGYFTRTGAHLFQVLPQTPHGFVYDFQRRPNRRMFHSYFFGELKLSPSFRVPGEDAHTFISRYKGGCSFCLGANKSLFHPSMHFFLTHQTLSPPLSISFASSIFSAILFHPLALSTVHLVNGTVIDEQEQLICLPFLYHYSLCPSIHILCSLLHTRLPKNS